MSKFILVDAMNMYFRSIHASKGRDIDTRIGMSLHIMMNSMKKCYNDFEGDHVVICNEGRSWRKEDYPFYKANRKLAKAQMSVREQEDQDVLMEAFNDLMTYFETKTNCTVLQEKRSEADDLIALWIQEHPKDEHIIVSTDSDFYQLLAENVWQYKGTTDELITLDGVFDKKGKKVKEMEEPAWILFEKCIRGDTSDNVFSAYPGVRKKGSKNKTGMAEAFADRDTGGYDYNNFMLQRWIDHEEKEHRVKEDYERNVILIDLTRQPDDIKESIRDLFTEVKAKPRVANVGIHFLKFCALWRLDRMSQTPNDYTKFLNAHLVNFVETEES
jgi:5'-3' exonuclease